MVITRSLLVFIGTKKAVTSVPVAAFVFSWYGKAGTEMGKVRDLTGQRFGRLVAQYYTGKLDKGRRAIWHCVCDCGNEIDVAGSAITSGNTSSCGCLRNGGVGGGIGGGKPVDHTGQRFGKLVAIKRIGSNEERDSLWLMECDCGNRCVKSMDALVCGNITSCGCKHKPYDHKYKRLHAVYHGMKARCYSKNHVSFKWYGARGIKVCDEWLNSFEAFKDWAIATGYDLDAPRGEYTLDRIDPDKDYEPSNCRWLTIAEQQRNKRAC